MSTEVKFLLFIACGVAQVAQSTPVVWASGRVIISEVDAALEATASDAFDDIERKTLLTFVRAKAIDTVVRSLAVRAASRRNKPGSQTLELCCFDTSKASQRQLSLALLKALGVTLDAGMLANKTSLGIRAAEAEAVNRIYVSDVMPGASELPSLVQVGVWQLAPGRKAAADWSSMIGGRGRRVVAGTSRWLANLQAAGHMAGVVSAVPTFIFRGNKAQVLLLGAQCSELVPGSTARLPLATSDEGLGPGIQRAMRYARSKGAVAGWPTHQGDGSLLLLRSPCATIASTLDVGESLESILADHRSAVALAQVARWARSQGALYGLPTFKRPSSPGKGSPLALEVVLVHRAVQGQLLGAERSSPLTSVLTLAGICTGLAVVACKFHKRVIPSQAERDLEFVVDSL